MWRWQMNPIRCDLVEDLASLPSLNESSAIHTLKQRYYSNLIHTYAGKKTLLVINPVRQLSVYTQQVCNYWSIDRDKITYVKSVFSRVFTVRSSYAIAVLGVILSVCPSVRLSVCHTHALRWNERTYSRYFDTTWKSNHSSFLTPTEVGAWWVMSPSTSNLRLKWPTPFEKRWLRPVFPCTVWTITVSEKCSIIANRKSTTCFPVSYRWSAYVTPNSPKGWLKK